MQGPTLAVQNRLRIVRCAAGIAMELRHLRSFLALAEELHFGRAAARLGVAQSAITRHLQLLEAELRFSVVERSSREVKLTAAGQTFRERIASQVEALDLAVEESREVASARGGRLRIGYVANLSYIFLPELLKRLRPLAPEAAFELHESPTPRQIEALHARRLDVGIALGPLDDAELMQRPLFAERLGVMMRAGHPLCAQVAIDLRTLATEPFVICPRYIRTGLHEVVRQRCIDAGFQPIVAQEVGGKSLLDELVAAGVGITLVPESAACVPRAGVVFRPLKGKVAPIRVHAIWRKENRAPLLRHFLDAAIAWSAEWQHARAACSPATAFADGAAKRNATALGGIRPSARASALR
jgi:DNA-binding transcriptional LysR family regulator